MACHDQFVAPGEGLEGSAQGHVITGRLRRSNGHHTAQSQELASGDVISQGGRVLDGDSSTTLVVAAVQIHLQRDIQPSAALTLLDRSPGGAIQSGDQPGAIHRMDDVGIPRDGACLLGLDLADHVNPRHPVRISAQADLLDFRPCLLIAALSDIAHTEIDQRKDIPGREELGHHDQGDACGVSAGV